MREAYRMGGEKALAFINLLDMLTYAEFHSHPDMPASAVIDGMETVRQKLSPLTVPSGLTSKFGEQLLKEVEVFLSEHSFSKDSASRVIEGNIKFIKEEKGGTNSFLKGLIGFIDTHMAEEAKNIRDKEKPAGIITPGVPDLTEGV